MAAPGTDTAVTLRTELHPGELGWIIQRHGALYAEEFGWDWRFEGVVAGIIAQYVEGFDPARARCWLAEVDGRVAGCIFLARETDDVGRLRLMLVESWARGRGIGARLIEECLAFARGAGYRRVVLWTNDPLVAARRLYQRAGFRLVHAEPAHYFGHPMMSETWELEL